MNDKLNSLVSGIKAKRAGRRRFAAAMAAASVLVSGSVFWTLHGIGDSLSTADMPLKTDIEEPDDDYFVPDHVAANGGNRRPGSTSVSPPASTSPESSTSPQKPAAGTSGIQTAPPGGTDADKPPDTNAPPGQDPAEDEVFLTPTGGSADKVQPNKAVARNVISVNGNANLFTTEASPYIVQGKYEVPGQPEVGDVVTLTVNLKRVANQSNEDEPYFIELSEEMYNEVRALIDAQLAITDVTARDYSFLTNYYGGAHWQYFMCGGKRVFTRANTWGGSGFTELDGGRQYKMLSDDVMQMTLRLQANTLAAGAAPVTTYVTFSWGAHQENVYLKTVQPGRLEIKGPSDSGFHANNTNSSNTVKLKGDETIELQGYTQYFTQITAEQYEALTSASAKAAYIKEKHGSYIKTDAKFWSFDVDADSSGNLQDTLLTKGGLIYSVEGDYLQITASYDAKNVVVAGDAKITFFDGSDIEKWKHYYDTYVTVQPKIVSDRKIYVKTNEGYRDINRIHEWLDAVHVGKVPNVDGYVENTNAQPYIMYPGDDVEIYTIIEPDEVYVQDGELRSDNIGFWCGNNDITVDGKVVKRMDTVRAWIVPRADGKYEYHKIYHAYNITASPVSINCSHNGNVEKTFFVEVRDTNTFDHADIEIADGGTYTITKRIQRADGTTYVIEEVYDSVISSIHGSKIYKSYLKDVEGGIHVDDSQLLEAVYQDNYKDSNGNILSGNTLAVYTARDYSFNGGSEGGTQYEYTSKWSYKLRFKQADVELVVFDVQLTLQPSFQKVYTLDANGNRIGTESISPLTGDAVIIEHAEFDMEKQSILDAVNKCPDHSGLDFTVIANEDNLIHPAEVALSAQKILKNGVLKGDQFEFELIDTLNTSDRTDDKVLFTIGNMADGSVTFPAMEFYNVGTFNYIIREKVPIEQDGNTEFDTHEIEVAVEVIYHEKSENDPDFPNGGYEAKSIVYRDTESGASMSITTGSHYDGGNHMTTKSIVSTDPNGKVTQKLISVSTEGGDSVVTTTYTLSDGKTHTIREKKHIESNGDITRETTITLAPDTWTDSPVTVINESKKQKDDKVLITKTFRYSNNSTVTGDEAKALEQAVYAAIGTSVDDSLNSMHLDFVNILKTYDLPATGGAGTTVYLMAGTVIMMAAAAAFVWNRRKEEN